MYIDGVTEDLRVSAIGRAFEKTSDQASGLLDRIANVSRSRHNVTP
jgi:hypothetical protein